jgi:hypothetical protein
MSVSLVGNLTISELSQTLAAVIAALRIRLLTDLDASTGISAGLSLSVANPLEDLSASLNFVLSGQAASNIEATIPSQIVASAQAGISVQAGIQAGLNAELQTLAQIPVNAGGMYAYSVDTTGGDIASAMAAALAGGVPGSTSGQRMRGLLVVTTTDASFDALSAVLTVGE